MLCDIDKGYLQKIGEWTKKNDPAIRDVDFVDTYVSCEDDFVMYDNTNKCYYLFINESNGEDISFDIDKKVKAITYLDDGAKVEFTQDGNRTTFNKARFEYAINYLVRVVRIDV